MAYEIIRNMRQMWAKIQFTRALSSGGKSMLFSMLKEIVEGAAASSCKEKEKRVLSIVGGGQKINLQKKNEKAPKA
jgi:hypothetical protein